MGPPQGAGGKKKTDRSKWCGQSVMRTFFKSVHLDTIALRPGLSIGLPTG